MLQEEQRCHDAQHAEQVRRKELWAHDYLPRAITPRAARRSAAPYRPLDLLHLIGLGAAGGDHLDLRALGLADQRARERGGDGDLALLRIGFRFAHDLPDLLLFGVFIYQRDGGAEFDGVAGQLA